MNSGADKRRADLLVNERKNANYRSRAGKWDKSETSDYSAAARGASLMGWSGIVVVGVVVGLAGWWLHPLRRRSGARLWMAVLAGVLGAALARMAGNVTTLFHDGDTLEWPICTAVALVAVAAAVGMLSRRR
jgi:uncharacterized membrane protein YeaQ/YmgE (transglycosylase-associated protein family)